MDRSEDFVVGQRLCTGYSECINVRCVHRIPHQDDTCFQEPDVFYCPYLSGRATQCRPSEEFDEIKKPATVSLNPAVAVDD